MKAPKLLPWIANKNGITEQHALSLWRRAAGEAEVRTGCCNSSDYYRQAMSQFIELAQEEGVKCAARHTVEYLAIIPDFSGMVHEQNRFWRASQLATQKAYGFWLNNLKYLFFDRRLVH